MSDPWVIRANEVAHPVIKVDMKLTQIGKLNWRTPSEAIANLDRKTQLAHPLLEQEANPDSKTRRGAPST